MYFVDIDPIDEGQERLEGSISDFMMCAINRHEQKDDQRSKRWGKE